MAQVPSEAIQSPDNDDVEPATPGVDEQAIERGASSAIDRHDALNEVPHSSSRWRQAMLAEESSSTCGTRWLRISAADEAEFRWIRSGCDEESIAS